MNLRILGLLIVGALATTGIGRADDFFFDFTPDSGVGFGSGDVTGEILGLTDNATSQPTEVVLESAPSAFDVTSPEIFTGSVSGTFTVTGGEVTAANAFYVYSNGGHTEYLQFNYSGTNELWESSELHAYNSDGFEGTTYTPESGPVPEPSQYGMGIFLVVAGFVGYRKFFRKGVTA